MTGSNPLHGGIHVTLPGALTIRPPDRDLPYLVVAIVLPYHAIPVVTFGAIISATCI